MVKNTGRKYFDFDDRLLELATETEREIRPAFERIESIAFSNQQKVLAAFINNGVGESCFTSSTGYGYGDVGRDKLERVFADAMECEIKEQIEAVEKLIKEKMKKAEEDAEEALDEAADDLEAADEIVEEAVEETVAEAAEEEAAEEKKDEEQEA